MPSFNSFGGAADHFARYRKEWEGSSLNAKAKVVGEMATTMAVDVARQDLGADAAFTGGKGRGSGWRPATNWLQTKAFVRKEGVATVQPTGRSAGPWTVAERGRNAYAVGDKRSRGMGKRRKDGTRKERFSTVKGTVGATRGFGTATKAQVVFQRDIPKVIERIVNMTNTDYFG